MKLVGEVPVVSNLVDRHCGAVALQQLVDWQDNSKRNKQVVDGQKQNRAAISDYNNRDNLPYDEWYNLGIVKAFLGSEAIEVPQAA